MKTRDELKSVYSANLLGLANAVIALREARAETHRIRLKPGEEPDSMHAAALADLDQAERGILGSLDSIRRDARAAVAELDTLRGPAMTPAEVTLRAATMEAAQSLTINEIEAQLRASLFEGDGPGARAWAQAAQATLDRASDAGTHVSQERTDTIRSLARDAGALGIDPTQADRETLRARLVAQTVEAGEIESTIIAARGHRGADQLGRGMPDFRQGRRMVPFPDKVRTVKYSGDGYREID